TINADSPESLLNAFLQNMDLIDEQSRSIAAPGVAVNTLNRFQHLDELYYAVFQPVESSFWEGNLKHYQMVNQAIHGKNGPAIDGGTGYFKTTSQSFWSSSVDGADVIKGGARENVDGRRLFYSDPTGATIATRQLDWESTDSPDNAFFGLSSVTAEADRSRL